MRAWVLHGADDIRYEDMKRPTPRAGEVLIRVKAAGICGSDIPRIYETGAHRMPLIPGHEFSGVVEAVGDGASEKLIGKRVGVFPLIPCQKCPMCRQRRYELCRNYNYIGSRCDGAFAEYVVAPEWNLLELPDDVSYEQAAVLEPMAVAVHAMRRWMAAEDTDRTQSIAVCGLGTVGLLLVMCLLDAGYEDLLLIGNKDLQLEKIKGLGMSEDRFCDVRIEDVSEWVKKRTKGRGVDVFFECVGKNETISFALNNTAVSGDIILVGNPWDNPVLLERDIYWKILRNQLSVLGAWNSSFWHNENDDWQYALNRIGNGKIMSEKAISHRLPLDKLEQGLRMMRDKTEEYGKVMIVA